MSKKTNTPYTPTAQEFRDLYFLDKGYKIPLETRKQYSRYIIGSLRMYKELVEIKERKDITILFEGKEIELVIHTDNDVGWLNFINLGKQMKLECYYYNNKNYDRSIPFWTYGIFNKSQIAQVSELAYQKVNAVLNEISGRYHYNYQIELNWRCFFDNKKPVDMMNPIWMDGIEFKNDMVVINPTGTYEFLDRVKYIIPTNRWYGDHEIFPLVKKITHKEEYGNLISIKNSIIL